MAVRFKKRGVTMDYIEKVRKNIQILCKIQGKQLGKVEEYAGKRAGYLTRNKSMDICTLSKFAEYFSVTMYDLLENDYRKEEIERDIGLLNNQIEKIKTEISELENRKRDLQIEERR